MGISILRYPSSNTSKKEAPATEFLYVGTENGLESQIVPKAKIPFKTIKIQGFKRSLSPQNFKTIYLFLTSINKAKKIIREFQPDVVIGTGGYVSGAVVYAAHQLKIPTIIHEQNSIPGMTNKFLSRYVDKIAICFPDVASFFPKEKNNFNREPAGTRSRNGGKVSYFIRVWLGSSKENGGFIWRKSWRLENQSSV
ncbi:hypothetical protein EfsSVR2330_09270 [Enterococcus faecalis]|nr:hypothetical protein EfsSVR2330_09270 [Enterococcus faecalis]